MIEYLGSIADDNINDRIAKFSAQLQNKFFYRIPLRYLCDSGKINFPTKVDMKIRCTLETDIKNYLNQNQVTNIGTLDVQIVMLKAPFMQYEQLVLPKNFRHYLETILFSAKVLHTGIQKTPYLKTYELQVGAQDFTVDFLRANRQFDWVEILLVYDKSDKHFARQK